jgi:ATP-dependent DNA helicase RecG
LILSPCSTATFPKNDLQRLDEFLYPPEAIREGLVNAFAYRDYTDSSDGIAVRICPKRLEIWNSGSLPEGITPETLINGRLSVLRNPDIAHVLYLRRFMEKGSLPIMRCSFKEQLHHHNLANCPNMISYPCSP